MIIADSVGGVGRGLKKSLFCSLSSPSAGKSHATRRYYTSRVIKSRVTKPERSILLPFLEWFTMLVRAERAIGAITLMTFNDNECLNWARVACSRTWRASFLPHTVLLATSMFTSNFFFLLTSFWLCSPLQPKLSICWRGEVEYLHGSLGRANYGQGSLFLEVWLFRPAANVYPEIFFFFHEPWFWEVLPG